VRKITFPKIMAASFIKLQKTTGVRHAPAGPLVMVADDDADTRLLFRTVLEFRGYGVVEAADGEETVRLAESTRPDLILMDGSLPYLSGLDATRLIRGSAHGRHVPIIFISGHAGAVFVRLAHEAGCDEYLVKPVDLDKLEHVLEKYRGSNARAVAI